MMKKTLVSVGVVMTIIMWLFACRSSSTPPAMSWTSAVIDNTQTYWFEGTSIAVDNNDSIHASYYDISSQTLKYATNTTGSWATTTIDTNINGSGSFSRSIVRADSNNKVHIIYYQYATTIKYASDTSGSWLISTITSTAGNPSLPSMVIDANDKLHISYYNGTGLVYMTNNSGSWDQQMVDPAGYLSAIAVDMNNKIHIIYAAFEGSVYRIKYANNISGSWDLSTANTSSVDYNGLGLAVDANIKAHVTFGDSPASNDLKYLTNATNSWVVSTIGHKFDNWSPTTITIDSNGKFHICSPGEGGLEYITDASGLWATHIADHSQAMSSSLALDSTNKAHIVSATSGGQLIYLTPK